MTISSSSNAGDWHRLRIRRAIAFCKRKNDPNGIILPDGTLYSWRLRRWEKVNLAIGIGDFVDDLHLDALMI